MTEKIEALLKFYLRIIPEFEVKDKIIIKAQKEYESIIKIYNDKFKDLLGKELSFVEKKQDIAENDKHSHDHAHDHVHVGHTN